MTRRPPAYRLRLRVALGLLGFVAGVLATIALIGVMP
jgi:hypothetical protein